MDLRKAILVTVLVLSAGRMVCADMVRMSEASADWRIRTASCDVSEPESPGFPNVLACSAIVDDWGFLSTVPPASARADAGGVDESRPVPILSDRQDSRSLCLYALFTLGLCKSAPWVKKLSLGVVPGWYHDGGPFQVGHSHAISPDCLTVASGYCFIQPGKIAHDPSPHYRREMIVSLWRESQFTYETLVSRGPPTCPVNPPLREKQCMVHQQSVVKGTNNENLDACRGDLCVIDHPCLG